MRKVLLLLAIATMASAQVRTLPPLYKTVAVSGRDTLYVPLPSVSSISAKSDTIQGITDSTGTITSATFSVPSQVYWDGALRIQVRQIAGVACDSARISAHGVGVNPSTNVARIISGTQVYAFGDSSATGWFDFSDGLAHNNPTALTGQLDPFKAIAIDIESNNTGGSTRFEVIVEVYAR